MNYKDEDKHLYPVYVLSSIERAGTCRHCGRITGYRTELCGQCKEDLREQALAARARTLHPVPKCPCGREVIPGYDECGEC